MARFLEAFGGRSSIAQSKAEKEHTQTIQTQMRHFENWLAMMSEQLFVYTAKSIVKQIIFKPIHFCSSLYT
jgi:hypothetical protein